MKNNHEPLYQMSQLVESDLGTEQTGGFDGQGKIVGIEQWGDDTNFYELSFPDESIRYVMEEYLKPVVITIY